MPLTAYGFPCSIRHLVRVHTRNMPAKGLFRVGLCVNMFDLSLWYAKLAERGLQCPARCIDGIEFPAYRLGEEEKTYFRWRAERIWWEAEQGICTQLDPSERRAVECIVAQMADRQCIWNAGRISAELGDQVAAPRILA